MFWIIIGAVLGVLALFGAAIYDVITAEEPLSHAAYDEYESAMDKQATWGSLQDMAYVVDFDHDEFDRKYAAALEVAALAGQECIDHDEFISTYYEGNDSE